MLVHHLLLLAAVGLLIDAGARAAGRISNAPAIAFLATVTFAAGLAVVEALALGLAGLGADPLALTVAAAATALVTRRLIASSPVRLWEALSDRWAGLTSPSRAAIGAAFGAGVAWTVWLLGHPVFDWDNLAYHIPEIVSWVHNGRPGSLVNVLPGFPYANLPVTNEVLLTWMTGISRSFIPIALWPAVLLALLATAGWVGLRSIKASPLQALLAVGSVCAAPMLTSFQSNGANSDFPALVWLVVTAALCCAAVAQRQAGVLAPALLAAALAIGAKTTVAPLALISLAIAFWLLRASLAAHRRTLFVCGAGAVAVGGVWYLRDLFDHGSPLWPYYATPWGDPLPHLQQPDVTFFDRPLATLRRFGEAGYATDTFLGGLVVLAGGLLAPLLARRRTVLLCAAATAVSVLLWMFAPDTGAPYPNFPATDAFHGSLRFLMPSVAAATVTLVYAGRDGRRGIRLLVAAALAAALSLNLVQLFELGQGRIPAVATPLLGAVVGAALAAFPTAGVARAALGLKPIVRGGLAALGAIALAGALTVGGDGYVERAQGRAYDALLGWFERSGHARGPIYSAPVQLVLLTGDELERPIVALQRTETCAQIARHARTGSLVVVALPTQLLLGPSTTDACVRGWRTAYEYAGIYFVYDRRAIGDQPASG